jgi:hypothetical protein
MCRHGAGGIVTLWLLPCRPVVRRGRSLPLRTTTSSPPPEGRSGGAAGPGAWGSRLLAPSIPAPCPAAAGGQAGSAGLVRGGLSAPVPRWTVMGT